MGSFRSQPELTKHSIERKGNQLNFAASHMCGNYSLIKVGEFTWKMLTFLFLLLATKRTQSLEYSMDMEVSNNIK